MYYLLEEPEDLEPPLEELPELLLLDDPLPEDIEEPDDVLAGGV